MFDSFALEKLLDLDLYEGFFSLTPEREGDRCTYSATGLSLHTQHPAKRFVFLLDFPCHSSSNVADAEVSSVAMAGDELVQAIIFVKSTSTGTIYVPNWDVVNDSVLDDAEVCRSMVDQLAPPSAEVRLRSEHNYRERKKFESRCQRQTNLLREKDVEIASLKAQLVLKEAEAAEAIRLRGQVSVVEAAEVARVAKLNDLKERTMALEGQVAALESAAIIKDTELAIKASSLESEKEKLVDQVSTLETVCYGLCDQVSGYELFKEQYEVVQDEQVKILSDKILSCGLRLVIMKCLQSLEYLAALRGAIGRAIDKGMQDGLAAGIKHEKAGRGLTDVVAYNPSAEANYVSAVNSLLAQLASQKDASMSDIMGLLRLEGRAAETLEANQLQPSPGQLMLPIHLPLIEPLSAENLIGEASTSGVSAMATTTALSTTFIQTSSVPPISVANYEFLGAGPSIEIPSPLKIVFEKEELETTPEHTTAP
ncbi:hypothetical protein Tco_1246474 [Tanacetum coccineum]